MLSTIEAAVAMHPLNQIDCEQPNISPNTTIRK